MADEEYVEVLLVPDSKIKGMLDRYPANGRIATGKMDLSGVVSTTLNAPWIEGEDRRWAELAEGVRRYVSEQVYQWPVSLSKTEESEEQMN